ncbi:hypothetical protein D082_29140 [Synechocystis sp. PCC 6714]|nr:hypothetical protein D082_29140 [Synechocystis sp. PCC 6714]
MLFGEIDGVKRKAVGVEQTPATAQDIPPLMGEDRTGN